MTIADCRLCNTKVEVKGTLRPDTVFLALACGHTANWITGDCYTEEQMKDREKLLISTIDYQVSRYSALKLKMVRVIEEA